MKVRWIIDACGRTAGTEEDVPADVAPHWIRAGIVVEVKQDAPKSRRTKAEE